jgi:hypothetical protein
MHSDNATYTHAAMIAKNLILTKDNYLISAMILRDHSVGGRSAGQPRDQRDLRD